MHPAWGGAPQCLAAATKPVEPAPGLWEVHAGLPMEAFWCVSGPPEWRSTTSPRGEAKAKRRRTKSGSCSRPTAPSPPTGQRQTRWGPPMQAALCRATRACGPQSRPAQAQATACVNAAALAPACAAAAAGAASARERAASVSTSAPQAQERQPMSHRACWHCLRRHCRHCWRGWGLGL